MQLHTMHKPTERSLQASTKYKQEKPNNDNFGKPDVWLTSDLNETVKVMIDHLIPKDEQIDDIDYNEVLGPYQQDQF